MKALQLFCCCVAPLLLLGTAELQVSAPEGTEEAASLAEGRLLPGDPSLAQKEGMLIGDAAQLPGKGLLLQHSVSHREARGGPHAKAGAALEAQADISEEKEAGHEPAAGHSPEAHGEEGGSPGEPEALAGEAAPQLKEQEGASGGGAELRPDHSRDTTPRGSVESSETQSTQAAYLGKDMGDVSPTTGNPLEALGATLQDAEETEGEGVPESLEAGGEGSREEEEGTSLSEREAKSRTAEDPGLFEAEGSEEEEEEEVVMASEVLAALANEEEDPEEEVGTEVEAVPLAEEISHEEEEGDIALEDGGDSEECGENVPSTDASLEPAPGALGGAGLPGNGDILHRGDGTPL